MSTALYSAEVSDISPLANDTHIKSTKQSTTSTSHSNTVNGIRDDPSPSDGKKEAVQPSILTSFAPTPVLKLVIPPLNFAMVAPGVYRSGLPHVVNHSFLKSLRLKTLIFLCPEDCNESNLSFCRESNVRIMQFGIQGNKEPFTDIPDHVSILKHINSRRFLERSVSNVLIASFIFSV